MLQYGGNCLSLHKLNMQMKCLILFLNPSLTQVSQFLAACKQYAPVQLETLHHI